MKKSTLALSALTLALAASLSACSGGTSSHVVAGTVTGLEFETLVLTTNGMDVTVKPAGKDANGNIPSVRFTFPNALEYGEEYDITVKTDPAHQECKPYSFTKEVAGRLTEINATIECKRVANTIGGSVTGLTVEGLQLINGSNGGILAVPKDATSFVFADKVVYGETYGVTVYKQPQGLNCRVDNGSGEMGDNKVESIAVVCQPA